LLAFPFSSRRKLGGKQKKTTRKQPECVHKEEANMQTERLLNEEGEENYELKQIKYVKALLKKTFY
jgi:hypothetical protein